jgi:hypothetical protein
MGLYRKKPVVIEAIQWDGNTEPMLDFCKSAEFIDGELYIQTLEGNMKASIGDFIIKGVQGEFYACKPDIFNLTYEKELWK